MNLAIVGLQWGDEGKGKVVDFLARDFDVNARYQGGANAGHTVRIKDRTYIFHQIPCGILNKGVVGFIGAGCVLDPSIFFEELANLKGVAPDIEDRIRISRFCHLVMPYHIIIDRIREESKQGIGTTRKGIGVAYEDKYGRAGIRVGDLYNQDLFEKKLRLNISRKNLLLMDIYHVEPLSDSKIYNKFLEYAERMKPMLADDGRFFSEAISKDKRLILEGAQGALLDIDFGTYPFVTASHTIAGGACVGLGISPTCIDRVVGVAKAYTTRVGEGPFPTENNEEMGEALRDSGAEYGSTTGRPRRCGPLDIPLVRYSARLSGVREIFLTKLDVLSSLERIKVAVRYKTSEDFDPFSADRLEPIYEELPGFPDIDISRSRDYDDLPSPARDYVKFIEGHTGLKVSYISIGSERDAVIKT